MKKCSRCEDTKPPREFSKKKGNRDGLHSWCKQCKNEYQRDYYAKNREHLRAKALERYYANHKENRAKRHAIQLASHGMTPAEYERMLDAQGGKCAICRQPETAKRNGRTKKLAVDHCHDTGAIRGLLCQGCNAGVGGLRDSSDLVFRAARYLLMYERVSGVEPTLDVRVA